MAIDFPNSPTLNQMFSASGRTWKWTGVRWEIVVLNADTLEGYTTMSDTAPQVGVPGSRWYKTTTGQEYIYYNDTWVEV